jgi:metal-dependent amidase/aminoacylase/carboxypeptidase family protein
LEGYPVTNNDPKVSNAVRASAVEVLGANNVVELPFDTWAEDFGYMTERVPGAMFWLGVVSERVPHPVWHSASFDLDEGALPVGAAVLAASALRLLKERATATHEQ